MKLAFDDFGGYSEPNGQRLQTRFKYFVRGIWWG